MFKKKLTVNSELDKQFLNHIASLSQYHWIDDSVKRAQQLLNDLIPTLEDLLKKGANINATFGEQLILPTWRTAKDTPLTFAVTQKNYALAQFLLSHGAHTEVFESDKTPLMKAAFGLSNKFISLLLSHHANVNTKNSKGMTAMDYVFSLKDWSFNYFKPKVMKGVTQLLDAGFEGNIEEICQVAKKYGHSDEETNFIREIWRKCYDPAKHKPETEYQEQVKKKQPRPSFFKEPIKEVIDILEKAKSGELSSNDFDKLLEAMNKKIFDKGEAEQVLPLL